MRLAPSGRQRDGAPLFGYDCDPKTKKRFLNDVEATAVRLVFQRAAEGWTPHRLAKWLNGEGYCTKRGRLWTPTGVRRLLANRGYTGIQFYSLKGERNGLAGHSPEVIRMEGFSPPIVSSELFERVQGRTQERQADLAKSKIRFLLTGFARCIHCEAPLIGFSQRGKHRGNYFYYRCSKSLPTSTSPATCEARYVSAEEVEEDVWSLVSASVSDPDMLKAELRRFLRENEGDSIVAMASLRAKMAENKREVCRLLKHCESDVIGRRLGEGCLAALKVLGDAMERLLRILEEQQRCGDDAELFESRIVELSEEIFEHLAGLDKGGMRAVMKAFDVKVKVSREEVFVRLTVDPKL